ncbi:MAG: hypothetical protein GXP49_13480 [Deltaproteobacteria bacterium]|nr:hypothetical protein [Deltaproteobacteria bacterium]
MRIKCPGCNAEYSLPREKAVSGKKLKCPRCGKVIVIKRKSSTGNKRMPVEKSLPGQQLPQNPDDQSTQPVQMPGGFGTSGLDWDDESAKETRIASLEDIFGPALTEPDEEAEAGWKPGENLSSEPIRTPHKDPGKEPAEEPEEEDNESNSLEWSEEEKETVFADFSDVFAPAPARVEDDLPEISDIGDLKDSRIPEPDLESGRETDQEIDDQEFDDETIMADVSGFVSELMGDGTQSAAGSADQAQEKYPGRPARQAREDDPEVGQEDERYFEQMSPGDGQDGRDGDDLSPDSGVEQPLELAREPGGPKGPGAGSGDTSGFEGKVIAADEVQEELHEPYETQEDRGEPAGTVKHVQASLENAEAESGSALPRPEGTGHFLDELVQAYRRVPLVFGMAVAGLMVLLVAVVSLFALSGGNKRTSKTEEAENTLEETSSGKEAEHEKASKEKAGMEDRVKAGNLGKHKARISMKGEKASASEKGDSLEARKLLAKIFLNKSKEAEAQARLAEARIFAAASLAQVDDEKSRSRLRSLMSGASPVLLFQNRRGIGCDSLGFSSANDFLVCCTKKRSVAWSLESGKQVFEITAAGWTITSSAILESRGEIALGCSDGKVRFFSLKDGSGAGMLKMGEESVVGLSSAKQGELLFGTNASGDLVLWNTKNKTQLTARNFGIKGRMGPSCISGNGSTLAAVLPGNLLVVLDEKGLFEKYRMSTKKENITAAACSDQGNVAIGLADGEVRLIEEGSPRIGQKVLGRHDGAVTGLEFNGSMLASSGMDHTVRTWSSEGQGIVKIIGHKSPVNALAFGKKGKLLASSTRSGIFVWNVETGRQESSLTGISGAVDNIEISSDDSYLAAACSDGSARFFDTEKWKETSFLPRPGSNEPITFVTFATGGHLVATGTRSAFDIWEFPSLEHLEGLDISALAGAFSPRGKKLAMVGRDHRLRIYTVGRGRTTVRLSGIANPDIPIAFGPRGDLLAVASGSNRVVLLNLKRRRKASHKVNGVITSLAFSPAGDVVALGLQGGTVVRWLLSKDREAPPIVLGVPVTALAFSNDGEKIAAGGSDGVAAVWEDPWSRVFVRLPPHMGPISGLAFSHGATRLVTAGKDGLIRVWDLFGAKNRKDTLSHGLTPAKLLTREEKMAGLILDGDELVPDPDLLRAGLQLKK